MLKIQLITRAVFLFSLAVIPGFDLESNYLNAIRKKNANFHLKH